LTIYTLEGQTVRVNCIEKERKVPDSEDPIIIRTCFIKNYKFKETSYPDYAGRYFNSEHEVYLLAGKKYIKINNSDFFNKKQDELESMVNERIQSDFRSFLTDSLSRDCLVGLDSIPKYKVNDLEISFMDNEIWFQVRWGLPGACRPFDGTIVSFKLREIGRFIK